MFGGNVTSMYSLRWFDHCLWDGVDDSIHIIDRIREERFGGIVKTVYDWQTILGTTATTCADC